MTRFITVTYRPEHCDPLFLLRKLGRDHDYCALLESADRAHGVNDLSFLALGARDVIRHDPAGKGDVLAELRERTSAKRTAGKLAMGYIGFLSFEAARRFDDIALTPDPDVPDALFVLPEVLLRIDHKARTVTLTAHADTALDVDGIGNVIESSPFKDDTPGALPAGAGRLPELKDIEPLRQTSRERFCKNVETAKEAILAGEAFQVVLSQELKLPAGPDPVDVYERLRAINPSPYMYCFRTPGRVIVGASPETLLRVDGGTMLYRPIAGTRRRVGDKTKDDAMREELLCDPKERCEHQMLVDLGRNDVGRCAEIGSVKVHDPFHVETYAHVFHIVSDVTGILRKDLTALDALAAVFPAGTLTGAPKLRAMEILSKLEGSPRGIYGGAFGYVDLGGNIDFAITIRTLTFDERGIGLRVGAGIVKDSVPEHEDNECLHKARSCLAAVFSVQS